MSGIDSEMDEIRRQREKLAKEREAETSARGSDVLDEMDEIRKRREALAKKREKAKAEEASATEEEASGRGIDSLDEMDEIRRRRAALAKKREEAEAKEADAVAEEPPAEERIYVVKKGDNLSKIAKEVYGNAGRWKEIYKANKDRIKDPNLIRPGWKLRIP
jgi:nucleoid-associated protein YgaU